MIHALNSVATLGLETITLAIRASSRAEQPGAYAQSFRQAFPDGALQFARVGVDEQLGRRSLRSGAGRLELTPQVAMSSMALSRVGRQLRRPVP
jgi:hypothetical protein